MNKYALLTTTAHQQREQSEVALTATLLKLLTEAQSKLEIDYKAAQSCLARATALLKANLERNVGPKVQSPYRGGLPRWQVKRLTAFIEENLEQPIRSPDLIALTGLSTGHFFRSFKETFGQAPFAYIAKLRIERAQQMMLTSSHSLSQIALDCGMCDQSHLTRLFRQLVGMTPGEWRRLYVCGSIDSMSAKAQFA